MSLRPCVIHLPAAPPMCRNRFKTFCKRKLLPAIGIMCMSGIYYSFLQLYFVGFFLKGIATTVLLKRRSHFLRIYLTDPDKTKCLFSHTQGSGKSFSRYRKQTKFPKLILSASYSNPHYSIYPCYSASLTMPRPLKVVQDVRGTRGDGNFRTPHHANPKSIDK